MLEVCKKKVRITLREDILGTAPNDQEIYSRFIASKAPNAQSVEDEIATVGLEEYADRQVTVFHRDENGTPFIYDYLIKGFFKNACKAMREVPSSKSSKLKAYKTKIDNLVFVEPRKIYFDTAEDFKTGICERPLRASTAQGERIALSMSETIPAGTSFEIEICTMNEEMMKFIDEWLDYGYWNGLGQWHNSGKGRFTYEEL